MPFTQIRVNVDKVGSRIDALFLVSSKNIIFHTPHSEMMKRSALQRGGYGHLAGTPARQRNCASPVTYAGWILISKDWSLIALTRCFRE